MDFTEEDDVEIKEEDVEEEEDMEEEEVVEDEDDEGEEEEKPKLSKLTKLPIVMDGTKLLQQVNKMTTKHKRREQVIKLKRLKKKAKKEERQRQAREREALGEDAAPKAVPHTLESLREKDSTVVDVNDEETQFEMNLDEYTSYFDKSYEPKVLITSCANPLLKTRLFLKELQRIIPNSEVFHRRQAPVKKMVSQAVERGYTEIIIVNQQKTEPCSMLISHLPNGPTAFFRLSSVKLTKHIKRDWKDMTTHRPEIILNNFSTRIGVTVARMLAALFHYDPQFKGRRAVTFHNQRDYVFVRHHRYEFKSGKKVALKELGPRFTLKLQSLQKGTFDSKTGEYEFIISDKRHKIASSRRKFFL